MLQLVTIDPKPELAFAPLQALFFPLSALASSLIVYTIKDNTLYMF